MATNETYTYKQFLDYVNRGDMKWERKDPLQSEILKKVIPKDRPQAINLIKRKMALNSFKKNISSYIGKEGISKTQIEAPVLDRLLLEAQERGLDVNGNKPEVIYSLLSLLNKEVANKYREDNEKFFDADPNTAVDIRDIFKTEKKKNIPSYIQGKPPKEAKKELFKRARLRLDKLMDDLKDNVELVNNAKDEKTKKMLDCSETILKEIKTLSKEFNKEKRNFLKKIGATRSEIGKAEFGLEKTDLNNINKIMGRDVLSVKDVDLIKTTAKKYYQGGFQLKDTLENQLFEEKIKSLSI